MYFYMYNEVFIDIILSATILASAFLLRCENISFIRDTAPQHEAVFYPCVGVGVIFVICVRFKNANAQVNEGNFDFNVSMCGFQYRWESIFIPNKLMFLAFSMFNIIATV